MPGMITVVISGETWRRESGLVFFFRFFSLMSLCFLFCVF